MTTEIVSYLLIALSTIAVWYEGVSYILKLRREIKECDFIYGDELHSLQHIAVVGIKLLLSLSLFFLCVQIHSHGLHVIAFFNNLALYFIVFPHLISEK